MAENLFPPDDDYTVRSDPPEGLIAHYPHVPVLGSLIPLEPWIWWIATTRNSQSTQITQRDVEDVLDLLVKHGIFTPDGPSTVDLLIDRSLNV